jgi:charged multivesicular body protein 5
LSAYN